uniref:HEAT repeat domain-containing protein n=1 Tax=candidate division WOR-3 bacterium TaxID=2052148 RepID=A0A7C4TEU6_UNCW3
MQQAAIHDFLKELAVGLKSAKSYPPGHPVMDKVVANTMAQLSKVFTETPEFSLYFLERTIIYQDTRIDASKNLALVAFLETLKKNEIESLTFLSGVKNEDLKNLYEVMSSGKIKLKEYGNAQTMLQAKGTERIKINAVKFGIQTGVAVQVAQTQEKKVEAGAIEQAELIAAIRSLKELVERGVSAIEMKERFSQVIDKIEIMPGELKNSYSETVTKLLEQIPAEHRVELLREVELKPIVLRLLSTLSEDTLLKLILARSNNYTDVGKIVTSLSDEKFSKVLPELKEKIPNIYEYLAQVGLLLSEKVTSLFSKEDLRTSIKPYYTMLDSQNIHLREQGLKSLIMLAERFIKQGQFEIVDEIINQVSVSLEQEAVEEVVLNSIEALKNFYKVAKEFNQEKFCKAVIEPFNRILGRPGISTPFKRQTIKFLGETEEPSVLPALFSFLWETGIYPDVRAAIIKFGKQAVSEALLTLKEAEDYSLRMKLVDILKNIGKEATDILIKNIDVPEWFLRRNIVAVLGDIGEKEIAPKIIDLLNDPDDRVRVELVKTFSKLEYYEGIEKALADKSMEVKTEALKGLKKIIKKETIMELLPLLKEKNDTLNAEILKIIGEKKVTESAPQITDFLISLSTRSDSDAQSLKELGITTLLKLNHPDTRLFLNNLALTKDKALANLATAALKRREE